MSSSCNTGRLLLLLLWLLCLRLAIAHRRSSWALISRLLSFLFFKTIAMMILLVVGCLITTTNSSPASTSYLDCFIVFSIRVADFNIIIMIADWSSKHFHEKLMLGDLVFNILTISMVMMVAGVMMRWFTNREAIKV